MDGNDFEYELAKLFRSIGYKVRRTGRSGDGGIDLELYAGNKYCAIVQCKAHRNLVGPGPVRDLYGAFIHHGGSEAWLISSSGFSKAAFEFSKGKPIRLLSIRDILCWQSQVQTALFPQRR